MYKKLVQKGNNWNGEGYAVVTNNNTIFTGFLQRNTTVLHILNTRGVESGARDERTCLMSSAIRSSRTCEIKTFGSHLGSFTLKLNAINEYKEKNRTWRF